MLVYHHRVHIRVGEVVRVEDTRNEAGLAMYAKVIWFGRFKVIFKLFLVGVLRSTNLQQFNTGWQYFFKGEYLDMEKKTDKWTYDEVGSYPENPPWGQVDVVKPIARILRKVILVPRPPVPDHRQSYRVLDLYRPTGKPYLSCFDEENIPPYPVPNQLVYVHGIKNLCRVVRVDDKNKMCRLDLLGIKPGGKRFYQRRSDNFQDVEIKRVRRQPKGAWHFSEDPPVFVEVVKDEHLCADWNQAVDDGDDDIGQEIRDVIQMGDEDPDVEFEDDDVVDDEDDDEDEDEDQEEPIGED